VFSATKEAKEEDAPDETSGQLEGESFPEKEKKFTPVTFRAACIPRLEERLAKLLSNNRPRFLPHRMRE
jgi:hypothetical protein